MQLFYLIFGLLITNITHLISAFDSVRKAAIASIGKRAYFAIYGVVSILGLALIIYGYIDSDFVVVFEPEQWMVNSNKDIMFFSLWLAASQFLKTYVKHYLKIPLMIAVFLWALGHLVANGDLYSVILFTGFLIYALIGIIIKLRNNFEAKNPRIINDVKAFFIAAILYITLGYMHLLIAGINVFIR